MKMKFLKKAVESFRKKIDALKNRPCEKTMSNIHKKYFENLYNLKIIENALNVGDKIPEFDMVDCFGNAINVKERLKQGPLVIKFFRGTWCMFCSTDLQFLSENYEELTKLGGSAVAVSAMPLGLTQQTAKDGNYQFPLVSDNATMEIAKKFGLVIRLPEELTDLYRDNYGVDLSKIFGKREVEVILPSTYVINQQGIIVYTYLEEDFKKRADVTEVLRAVKHSQIDAKAYYSRCFERECQIEAFLRAVMKKVNRQSTSSASTLSHSNSISSTLSHSNSISSTSSSSSTFSSLFKKREKSFSESPVSPTTEKDTKLSVGDFVLPKLAGVDYEKDPFGYALQNEDFMGSFKDYLQKTFCTENLLFYFEVANYQSAFASRTDEENSTHANTIFDTFVKIGSDLEVNIDDVTREKVVNDFKMCLITDELFTIAAKEVYVLMETDSYSKWKRTKEYADVWKKNGSAEFLSPAPGFAAEAA